MLAILRICITLPILSYFYNLLFPNANPEVISILLGIGLASIPFFLIERLSKEPKGI